VLLKGKSYYLTIWTMAFKNYHCPGQTYPI